MKPCSRFLFSLAVAALLASSVADAAAPKTGTGPSFKGPIGLQLYSLRANFAKDVAGTLAKVQAYGIRNVELAGTHNLAPDKYREMLTAHGLKPISGHFPFERLRDDADGVAHDAVALGLQYAGCAWIPHQDKFDEQACRDAIAVFNHAGQVLASHGVKFFYHTHGYEFQPHGKGTLFDLLLAGTKPKLVCYEMDVFWIIHPAQNPVKLLAKYGKRFELMHVKDMKQGVKTGDLSGHTAVTNDVPLGTGQMDWPAILRAAKKAGIKYYFIEDESPTAAEQIPLSLQFLEKLKF